MHNIAEMYAEAKAGAEELSELVSNELGQELFDLFHGRRHGEVLATLMYAAGQLIARNAEAEDEILAESIMLNLLLLDTAKAMYSYLHAERN